MTEQKDDDIWEALWWLTRWALGGILHVALVFFALFSFEVVFETVKLFYTLHPEKNQTLSPNFIGFAVGVTVLVAGLAGASWFRQQYIRRCLPEVMTELQELLSKKRD